MSIDTHRIVIGACGWQHKAWLNDFYPDDLPEDWRLGFYANEFAVVYVPAADWLDLTGAAEPEGDKSNNGLNNDVSNIAQWSEDTNDSFRFILEIPAIVLNDENAFHECLKKVRLLDEYCLGLVFKLDQKINEAPLLLEKRIEAGLALAPVCIDRLGVVQKKEGADSVDALLKKWDVSEVWDGFSADNKNGEVPGLSRGKLAIIRVIASEIDAAQLRQFIEKSLSVASDDRVSALCLDGNPPSLEQLRNADIILNLL